MRVQITARHCDISDSVRERAETQMARLTRYDPRLSAAEVIFDEEKHIRKVEAILSIDRGSPVVARADDRDFRPALDKVVEKLSKQLRRTRDQVVDHQSPPLSADVLEEE
ncbi:MAG: ribosome-associated translation inhibitor RaiA [Longimicrobiales bacterium]